MLWQEIADVAKNSGHKPWQFSHSTVYTLAVSKERTASVLRITPATPTLKRYTMVPLLTTPCRETYIIVCQLHQKNFRNQKPHPYNHTLSSHITSSWFNGLHNDHAYASFKHELLLSKRHSSSLLTLGEKFLGSWMSWRDSFELNFTAIRAMMVDRFRLDHQSVWIFLKMEKPLSESAFDTGIERRPAIRWNNFENLGSPSNVLSFPTSHQK